MVRYLANMLEIDRRRLTEARRIGARSTPELVSTSDLLRQLERAIYRDNRQLIRELEERLDKRLSPR